MNETDGDTKMSHESDSVKPEQGQCTRGPRDKLMISRSDSRLAVRGALEALISLAELSCGREEAPDMALVNLTWRTLAKLRTFSATRRLLQQPQQLQSSQSSQSPQRSNDGKSSEPLVRSVPRMRYALIVGDMCADSSRLRLPVRSAGKGGDQAYAPVCCLAEEKR